MQTVKIKKIRVKSAFKAILLALTIPWGIGVIIFILSAIATYTSKSLSVEQVIGSIIPLLYMPIIYAAVAILFVFSYNWLAPKFGGLEIEIEKEKIERYIA